jgi:hypothetical protein
MLLCSTAALWPEGEQQFAPTRYGPCRPSSAAGRAACCPPLPPLWRGKPLMDMEKYGGCGSGGCCETFRRFETFERLKHGKDHRMLQPMRIFVPFNTPAGAIHKSPLRKRRRVRPPDATHKKRAQHAAPLRIPNPVFFFPGPQIPAFYEHELRARSRFPVATGVATLQIISRSRTTPPKHPGHGTPCPYEYYITTAMAT